MRHTAAQLSIAACLVTVGLSCSKPESTRVTPTPVAVIDLGAVVTPDLPEQFWGKAFLKQMGFTRGNAFEVIPWEFPTDGGTVRGSNAYYTLFNHGGPHVDAPNHTGDGAGLDSYPVEAFVGPLKAFDVSNYAPGRSIPVDVFRDQVQAGDVVVVYTRYTAPRDPDELPTVITLTQDAAEFLSTLPVRAYGTDSFSVESLSDTALPLIHHSFLARGIPTYEQLLNVDKLLGKTHLYFVGAPLNIQNGDGMIVRPTVLVYE